MNSKMIVLLAFLLDLLLGDPVRPTHPIVLIGRFIDIFEKHLRLFFKTAKSLKIAGMILWFTTVFLAYSSTYYIIKIVSRFNPLFGYVINIWLTYTTLAVRNLADEALWVYREIKKGNIGRARKGLSHLVSRDTQHMQVKEICRATVETVAENTIDGIISPLVYAFIGGAPLAMAYKAINTLDSMVGYKNERYEFFGWFSARMDDFANYIPARIGGFLMILAAFFMGFDTSLGIKTVFSDARKHKSPNSGIPEAATAGVLRIRLGGWSSYDGVKSFAEYIGEKHKEIEPKDIGLAVRLCFVTAIITVVVFQSVPMTRVAINFIRETFCVGTIY